MTTQTSRYARTDAAMLKSMAASFRARMDFSFNPDDMADLMDRCAEVVKPGPRALPPAQVAAPAGEPVAFMLEGYGPTENRGFAEIYSRKKGVRVTPLYAEPAVPAVEMSAAHEARGDLEGAVNWLDALISQVDATSCDPDDPEAFDEVLMGARAWLSRGRAALAALEGGEA